jgi:hypothetical protein
MSIRKRSALLLGIMGFLSGVVFAQYRRKNSPGVLQNRDVSALPAHKAPHVPLQVVDKTMATARQQRKSGYTTH